MVPINMYNLNVSMKKINQRVTRVHRTVESCHSEKPTLGEVVEEAERVRIRKEK